MTIKAKLNNETLAALRDAALAAGLTVHYPEVAGGIRRLAVDGGELGRLLTLADAGSNQASIVRPVRAGAGYYQQHVSETDDPAEALAEAMAAVAAMDEAEGFATVQERQREFELRAGRYVEHGQRLYKYSCEYLREVAQYLWGMGVEVKTLDQAKTGEVRNMWFYLQNLDCIVEARDNGDGGELVMQYDDGTSGELFTGGLVGYARDGWEQIRRLTTRGSQQTPDDADGREVVRTWGDWHKANKRAKTHRMSEKMEG